MPTMQNPKGPKSVLAARARLSGLGETSQLRTLAHPLPELAGIIVQVSVSPGGLPKHPVPAACAGRLGLAGDSHAHPRIHGGPQRALLVITSEGLEELRAAGFPVFPGSMGENLTIEGLPRRMIRLGQRFQAGEAVIELVSPRVPCNALNVHGAGLKDAVYDAKIKAADAASPKWGLSGFYAAVVQPGLVRAGDRITIVDPRSAQTK